MELGGIEMGCREGEFVGVVAEQGRMPGVVHSDAAREDTGRGEVGDHVVDGGAFPRDRLDGGGIDHGEFHPPGLAGQSVLDGVTGGADDRHRTRFVPSARLDLLDADRAVGDQHDAVTQTEMTGFDGGRELTLRVTDGGRRA